VTVSMAEPEQSAHEPQGPKPAERELVSDSAAPEQPPQAQERGEPAAAEEAGGAAERPVEPEARAKPVRAPRRPRAPKAAAQPTTAQSEAAGRAAEAQGAAGAAGTATEGAAHAAERQEAAPDRQWYIIHTQTGQELKVKGSLEGKMQQAQVGEQISRVLVPTERVAEVRGGKKRISERKFFPGYLLIEMRMTDESWHLVRTTPGVTGFIGAGRRPVSLSQGEVEEILRQTEERKEKPIPRVSFQKGEGVRVIEGPFTNFSGMIEEVNTARGKLKVLVSIFGRQTPVELEFWQVERL